MKSISILGGLAAALVISCCFTSCASTAGAHSAPASSSSPKIASGPSVFDRFFTPATDGWDPATED
jgi:hypothetical protein